MIENSQDLSNLIKNITENHKLISIDTEQSFQDTFEGFLCLIQISTPNHNYIIDVLKISK